MASHRGWFHTAVGVANGLKRGYDLIHDGKEILQSAFPDQRRSEKKRREEKHAMDDEEKISGIPQGAHPTGQIFNGTLVHKHIGPKITKSIKRYLHEERSGIKLARELGVPWTRADQIRFNRSICIGTMAAAASKYGQCDWYAFPTLSLSDFGQLAELALHTNGSTIITNTRGWVHYVKASCLIRNNSNRVANFQVWQLNPKDDILKDDILPNTGDCYGRNPTMITGGFGQIRQPVDANGQDVTVEIQDRWNTPFENVILTQLFDIKRVFDGRLDIGGSMELHHGLNSFQINAQADQVTYINDFLLYYQHLKRLGPIFLLKVWGDISHDESTLAPSGPQQGKPVTINVGLCSLDLLHHAQAVYADYVLNTTIAPIDGNVNLGQDPAYWTAPAMPAAWQMTVANDGQFLQVAPNESAPQN